MNQSSPVQHISELRKSPKAQNRATRQQKRNGTRKKGQKLKTVKTPIINYEIVYEANKAALSRWPHYTLIPKGERKYLYHLSSASNAKPHHEVQPQCPPANPKRWKSVLQMKISPPSPLGHVFIIESVHVAEEVDSNNVKPKRPTTEIVDPYTIRAIKLIRPG